MQARGDRGLRTEDQRGRSPAGDGAGTHFGHLQYRRDGCIHRVVARESKIQLHRRDEEVSRIHQRQRRRTRQRQGQTGQMIATTITAKKNGNSASGEIPRRFLF